MNWFGMEPKSRIFETYLSNNTAPRPCLSWYGHRFEKAAESAIFCPICGTTKKL